jgi:hypothetical protein
LIFGCAGRTVAFSSVLRPAVLIGFSLSSCVGVRGRRIRRGWFGVVYSYICWELGRVVERRAGELCRVNPWTPVRLAQRGYADFDRSEAMKYVIDPHGVVAA